MRKLTKGLLVAVTLASLGWSVLSSLYTHAVSDELATLKRESHSDTVYLRCRLRELESELFAGLLDRLVTPTEPVGGTPAADTADTSADTAEAPTEAVTEAVTLPLHESPETRPSAEAVEPTALYLVGVHEGRIGLFDAAGNLIETVNVFVMTLPDADRAALEVGIPVASPEEGRTVMEAYE